MAERTIERPDDATLAERRPGHRAMTHYAGCWRHHHACAVRLVEEHQQFLDVLDGAGVKLNDLSPTEALERLRSIARGDLPPGGRGASGRG